MNRRSTFGLWLISLSVTACQSSTSYLDTDYPGLTPKPYAEGIVNIDGRFQQNITISPDGSEHYFTQTDSGQWRYERILRISQTADGHWKLDTPQFVKDFSYDNVWFIGEPMLNPSGDRMLFVADYPPALYQVQRTQEGEWGSLNRLPVSTPKADWYPTFTQADQLFFTQGALQHCTLQSGNWVWQDSLSIPFTEDEIRDPVVDPNGEFILFSAEVTTGYGYTDLYITTRTSSGGWSTPVNMGPAINTPAFELAPYLSPDGKYLFFSRRDQWQHATSSNIFWVSTELIDSYW
ncbi:MAG: hypothetical protein AAFQ98_21255 [Bacteroidota bacterium]